MKNIDFLLRSVIDEIFGIFLLKVILEGNNWIFAKKT